MDIELIPYGDQALLIRLKERISQENSQLINQLYLSIKAAQIPAVRSLIPAYSSLTVLYSPTLLSFEELRKELLQQFHEESPLAEQGKLIRLPVCYGGEFGPDLEEVSQLLGLAEEEVISRHSRQLYSIYMMGFLPGFAYMGDVNFPSSIPRKQRPRPYVPMGSVALAGLQTGVYPSDSSGGWQLIGRTPIPTVNPELNSPFLFSQQDRIQFVAIDLGKYKEYQAAVSSGSFKWEELYG